MTSAEVWHWITDNAVAIAALVLSFLAFVLPFFASLRADVVVRFTMDNQQTRLLISNYGSAKASDVKLSFTKEDGTEWIPKMHIRDLRTPIPALWPGDSICPRIDIPMAMHALIQVTVSWKDNRLRRQQRKSTVATYALPNFESVGVMRQDVDKLLKAHRDQSMRSRR